MKNILFLLLIPSFIFADPFGTETEQLAEVDSIVKDYNKYKNRLKKDLQVFKDGEIDEVNMETLYDEVGSETTDTEDSNSDNIGFSYNEISEDTQKCISVTKPDLDITLDFIKETSTKKLNQLEEFAYIVRWFYLANQVTVKDEGSIFYLLKDSEFDEKLDGIFNISMEMSEDFIPNSELIKATQKKYEEWNKYLNSIICNFGDIDKKFYSKIEFKATPTKGLNLRENPLTGVKLNSKYILRKGKTVYLKYFTFGTARNFSGKYSSKWAKVLVPTSKGNKIGWVNLRYLRQK